MSNYERQRTRNKHIRLERLCKEITFFKDYENDPYVNVDINGVARGSPIATFTATRAASAPATYVDANGVVQLVTTSDIPRFQGGYYDATGFHAQKGLMIEAARTNLLIRTNGTAGAAGLWTGWSIVESIAGTPTTTAVAIPELTSIAGAKSMSVDYVDGVDANKAFQATSTSTDAGSVVNGETVTLSFWARSSGITGANFTGVVKFRDAADAALTETATATLTLTTSWRYFTLAATASNANTSRARVAIGFSAGVDQGDVLNFEIWGVQLEKNPYATSFIPTTTASLTRGAEVLTYPILNNRTAEQETIVIKFAPRSAFANDNVERVICSTDTKNRVVRKLNTGTKAYFAPNITDSSAANTSSTTVPAANTSYVVCSVAYGSTAGTNAEIYINGISEGTDADNYTTPAWGTNFYVGSKNDGTLQLNGIIQKVAMFGRAMIAAEIMEVTTLWT